MFKPLHHIAKVSLGYKSLQNNFFYVNKGTIDTYGIEAKYLTPILMLKDLDLTRYQQQPTPSLWLFACKEQKGDLRGSGAWRYIEAMADRPAAERKQSGKSVTIREALEAQGPGLWYAPKAKPASHHIWVRKAVSTVFSPFWFEAPALVDQRLNSVHPNDGIEWREVAAALTSSLFAYSLEINGSASMGAGALEVPTTKLRDYPVLDVTALPPTARADLVGLAEDVWRKEAPVDWGSDSWQPGEHLRALDSWILATSRKDVAIDQLYADLRSTCRSRILVAADKTKKSKKQESDSIGSVASAIVKSIEPKLKTRNFPDDFVRNALLDLPLHFDRGSLAEISLGKLFDTYEISVRSKAGRVIYHETLPCSVAEAIVRAILLGRSTFSVSTDSKAMDAAIDAFLAWVSKAQNEIQTAVAESAFGTGYEGALQREVYARLGIHPLTGAKVLPTEIYL